MQLLWGICIIGLYVASEMHIIHYIIYNKYRNYLVNGL